MVMESGPGWALGGYPGYVAPGGAGEGSLLGELQHPNLTAAWDDKQEEDTQYVPYLRPTGGTTSHPTGHSFPLSQDMASSLLTTGCER